MKKLIALALIAVAAFVACTAVGAKGGMDVTATFTDVGDLAPGAPVMMADIMIGQVKDIELSGTEASVTMSIDPDAHVPEGVIARVRRTSLLGERIVDLVVPDTLSSSAPLLNDGDVIQQTEARPDLEDLVREGSAVLAPIAASEISTLVDAGAKGFGGQGTNLRTFLRSFRTIVHAYAGRTQQIESVIDSLDEFQATLASHATAQARSVANSAKALDVLRAESDRLVAAVKSLARLAVGARAILDEHSDEMSNFFRQMRVILGVLRAEESSIAGALKWAPHHNRNTQAVEYQQFNQVLQDFIVCGMNDDPSDPARKCPGAGEGSAHPARSKK